MISRFRRHGNRFAVENAAEEKRDRAEIPTHVSVSLERIMPGSPALISSKLQDSRGI